MDESNFPDAVVAVMESWDLTSSSVEGPVPITDAWHKTKQLEDDTSSAKWRRIQRKKLHSLHSYVACSGAVAVAASASMITRQVEQLTEEGRSCLAFTPIPLLGIIESTLSQVAAVLKGSMGHSRQLVSSVANAIGEPPRRPLHGWVGMEGGIAVEDAPLLLLWALNLFVLCSIASMFLFTTAFTRTGGPGDDVIGSLISGACDNTENGVNQDCREESGPMRVMIIISVALISGCGMGWRHPLQSALMCGF